MQDAEYNFNLSINKRANHDSGKPTKKRYYLGESHQVWTHPPNNPIDFDLTKNKKDMDLQPNIMVKYAMTL